jgi:hypothetical protein
MHIEILVEIDYQEKYPYKGHLNQYIFFVQLWLPIVRHVRYYSFGVNFDEKNES